MTIRAQDIDTLIELFESSDWSELHVRIQDFELLLSKDPSRTLSGETTPAIVDAPSSETREAERSQQARPPSNASVPHHWVAVKAPNLGTFYRAPKPGAPPFVELGQLVEADTPVCLIEVMKLFTALKAGIRGVVRRVCIEDSSMIEFGDVLFYIEPA